ncbi:protein of unknown function DUF569 [Dillenia turbinata]|uniref:DUF569 domain-containing protein n=1 Tax=Dillenia turbinata TaxID=194707 RepID=A0AAN8VFB1_9MAGN
MEFFAKAKAIRLKSHLGKFMVADEDEETVRQSRDGSSKNARWTVERVRGKNHVLRLKSRYGHYLTATDEPFLMGTAGKKVVQMTPSCNKLENVAAIEWEPLRQGLYHLKLRAKLGGKLLRANGGLPPWRNSITHDVSHRTATQDWVLWEVEVVEIVVHEQEQQEVDEMASCSSYSSEDSNSSFVSWVSSTTSDDLRSNFECSRNSQNGSARQVSDKMNNWVWCGI